jgi:NAD(P)-dependent dehydrogenase (short-subunit alcohol dehydrogenase family)
MDRADRKRSVVTGAASGIGLATVRRLLAEDVSVLAVDINPFGLEPGASDGAQVLESSGSREHLRHLGAQE